MIRVIHVLHHSLGYIDFHGEPESGLGGWHYVVAREIVRRETEFAVECWRPESTTNLTRISTDEYGIVHRIYPSVRIRYGAEISAKLIKSLRTEIKEHRNKVLLHLHGIYNANTYLVGLLCGGKAPIIVQSHDPLQVFFPGLRKIQHTLRRFALKKINRFFVSGQAEKDYLSSMVDPRRIKIQPIGIDLRRFNCMNRKQARIKLGWNTREPYVLYVGRLTQGKGIQYLIKASGILLREIPNLHLIIVGGGRLNSSVRSDLKKNIRLLGQIRHSDLPNYYNAADVLVLPSLMEASPRVIMESLACRTPVIATWTGCVPTLVRDGMNGLFVVPMRDEQALAREISKVLPNAASLRGQIERSKLEKYEWKNVVRNTVETYKSLV